MFALVLPLTAAVYIGVEGLDPKGTDQAPPVSDDHESADMNAIANALLAVIAADAGDTAAAREHISTAQLQSRATARRRRQVVEIAALIVTGDRSRAAGLALIHASEFPDDRELLARVTAVDLAG